MKFLKLIPFLIYFLYFGCSSDDDTNEVVTTDNTPVISNEINDFVWQGMNEVYLYKDEIPNLANNRFTNTEYVQYLNGFNEPEALFESLIYQPELVDRFSFIIDDYISFEQSQQGTSVNNGLEFNLYLKPNSTTEVFGIIRLVLKNSVADGLKLKRGQIFDAVNGIQLNVNNLNQLLGQNTYTLNFAEYDDNGTETTTDDSIQSTSEQATLTAEVYTENPIHLAEIIPFNGENVGYLVYNGFNSSFNVELNAAFEKFAGGNIQHLVLDLRYNPGGSVDTARLLGSMITGQFTGEIYSKLVYNDDLSEFNTDFEFVNNFEGQTINSLNLQQVYVLTTSSSASASELVINSLSAYIDVIQIGDFTTGKTQASVTIYDSPNFSSENRNPNHTYAIQPLIANSINVNDLAVPPNGLTPDIGITESPRNFGALGSTDEPLLALALSNIEGNSRNDLNLLSNFNEIKHNMNLRPSEEIMYLEVEDLDLKK